MHDGSDSHRPTVYMPLTPDYDRLSVIESQMSEMMQAMKNMTMHQQEEFSQIKQGLNDTTEEVWRLKEVQGSSSGRFAPPARIAEHEEFITENDQDCFPDANGQRAREPFEAFQTPAKRADYGELADAVERGQAPEESPAQAPGEACV